MQASITLNSEKQTEDLARTLRPMLGVGDIVFLEGDLGAGKTAFARALIQDFMRDSGLVEEVPSPSFTLVQTYEFDPFDIWHVDLYRLESADIYELGLETAFETAISLIEWPDRLGGTIEPNLRIELEIGNAGQRLATIHWQEQRFKAIFQK